MHLCTIPVAYSPSQNQLLSLTYPSGGFQFTDRHILHKGGKECTGPQLTSYITPGWIGQAQEGLGSHGVLRPGLHGNTDKGNAHSRSINRNQMREDAPELSVQSELVQAVTMLRLSLLEEWPYLLRPRRVTGGRAWTRPQASTTPRSICPNKVLTPPASETFTISIK